MSKDIVKTKESGVNFYSIKKESKTVDVNINSNKENWIFLNLKVVNYYLL